MNIIVGDQVRLYYEDDAFDVGVVQAVDDGWAVVDFLDWIEKWPVSQFKVWSSFMEGFDVLVPQGEGTMVQDFRKKT